MRPLLPLLVCTLLAGAPGAGTLLAQEEKPAGAAAAAPRAVVPEAVVDFGSVVYGTTRTHDFVVRNEGNAPLRIHRTRANCMCTVAEFSEEIAPGAEGKVSVVFDGLIEGGSVAIKVDAVTNDPENPTLSFTVKANVRYHVDARPGFVRYTVVQKFEGDSTIAQTLWANDGKPMRITKVESPYPFIEASFRQAKPAELLSDGPKEQWKVETRISPDAPIGPLSGLLAIHVDHPDQKLVKLPLHGFVRPMYAVTPVEAGGDVELGTEGARQSLHLKFFSEEPVAVSAVESSVAGITADLEEHTAGRIYYVVLRYSPEIPKGEFSGVVRIKTDSSKQPLIEVPLKGKIL